MSTKAKSFTKQQFLKLGLEIAGYKKWYTYMPHTQLDRFSTHYGVNPETTASVWHALQNLPVGNEHRLEKNAKPMHLLLGFRFLYKYHTEDDLGVFFGGENNPMCNKTVGKWCRIYTHRIESLLADKMGTLEENDNGMIFMMSFDGVHCPIWEPRPWSKKNTSHKFGYKPAYNYELGISIYKPKLIWVYGPTPGAEHDSTIFQEALMHALPQGRKVIADSAYAFLLDYVSTKNDLDSKELRNFKNRVSARHENFNQRLKCFKILDHKYRHGRKRINQQTEHIPHGVAFPAVWVLLMFQLENGGY